MAAMARWSWGMAVTMVVLAMWVTVAAAATPSPPTCESAAAALLPCYSYVTGPDATPPTECCGGLSSLSTNSPTCLCQLITQLKDNAASQPSVNITKALNLPQDCTINLNAGDCPALAGLLLPPPSASTPTSSPGPTAGGPAVSLVPGNDVPKLLPTSWITVVGAAAAVSVMHALW